ncbi:MAG: carph-isopro domain-containing protein [Alphaproteobacteria bacterium]
MSKSGKQPIENAVEIIERFGGIRPMASKTGVAVTTIQGWKKRGVIPGARKESVLESAAEHEVDLYGLVEGAPSLQEQEDGSDLDETLEEHQGIEPAQLDDTDLEQSLVDRDDESSEPDVPVLQDSKDDISRELEQGQDDEGGDVPGLDNASDSDKNSGGDDDLNDDKDDEADPHTDTDTDTEDDDHSGDNDADEKDSDEEKTASEDDDLEIPHALKRTAEVEAGRSPGQTKDWASVRAQRPDSAARRDYAQVVIETKKGAMTRSVIIAVVIILVVLATLAGLILPKYRSFEHRDTRIEELESELSALKKEQSGFKGLVSENWSEELEHLKRKAAQVKEGVDQRINDVKSFSSDLSTSLSGGQGLDGRVEQLQTYMSEIAGGASVYALKDRFDEMRQSAPGENALNLSVEALLPLVERVKGGGEGSSEGMLNDLIAMAREQSTALQASLGNVPTDELGAAAKLLAMTQVRSSLGRSDADFEDDLRLLNKMLGDENPELAQAIEKIAPHVQEGFLTSEGLVEEFQYAAADAVEASLNGEDVSVSQKLSAKLNGLLKVEKNGELLTGTQVQAAINRAEKLLKANRIEDVISLVQRELDAEALKPLRPWIKKAQGVVASRDLKRALEDAIEFNFGSGLLGGKVLQNNTL